MQRSLVIVLVLLAVIFSSCYTRVKEYDDGMGTYKYRGTRYNRHNYQKDQDYNYKSSYYKNHRPPN